MRRTPQHRPKSRDGNATASAAAAQPQPIQKKVFNCIVDETALLAGAKKSTRDGIRKWITNEQIRLFVPLHTLNQVTRIKDNATGRVATDAEEALVWLDDATSNAPHLVTLQGGYEKFETWAEVEKFALPKPLFSEEDIEEFDDDVDDLAETVESSMSLSADNLDKHLSMSSADSDHTRSGSPDTMQSERSSMSMLSPPESPAKTAANLHIHTAKEIPLASPPRNPTRNTSSDSGVPPQLRSLFNYILWRVQQEIDPAAALESFIFLCDDPTKSKLAQRFGIRVKSLADIRFVVAREEREFRNRQLVQRKENEKANAASAKSEGRPSNRGSAATVAAMPAAVEVKEISDDEEEIVFKRPPKGPAAMAASQPSPRLANKVMDPNRFSRSPGGGRVSGRGGAPRGGANTRGTRGASASVSAVAAARGDTTPTAGSVSTGPIDPNSFSRASPGGGRARGGRKLFVPT
ncbi:hypothetical protein AAFC00_006427 [Neodothiora populina]|uniref:PIN domain-containing protein n=1 Tax=Neodothiora populina TaxID=2781224 RepID=A0ABR3P556_9PEZI